MTNDFFKIPGLLLSAIDSEFDWFYKTHTDGNSCLGFKNNACIWSKGKGLGGSSSINAMIYVRGHPNDYEKWKEQGNQGWGYEDLGPYFENIENEFGLNNYTFVKNPFYSVLNNAWEEIGMTKGKETNEALEGTKIAKLLIQNGRRLNTAKHFLGLFKNLHVMKNTKVQNLLIDANGKIAVGVQVKHKSGIVMKIRAAKEVILSAGSIMTPQILMLSGIGPRKHLEEVNINCLLDLPVGKNLQDHSILHLFFSTNLSTVLTVDMLNLFVIQYMLTRTGIFSNIGIFDFLTFVDTNNDAYPDLQFYHSQYVKGDTIMLKKNMKGMGYKDEIIIAIEEINKVSDTFIIHPSVLHPKSKGEILLKDNNPESHPIIKTNYFTHREDIEIYIKSIQLIKKLEKTHTFKMLGMKLIKLKIEACSNLSEIDYWVCYLKHVATTVYHPVGTVKMGKKDDITSVIDNNLKVHGIERLRIVDASIMPAITGGNTLATTLVIAEKAADIIKQDFNIKDEL